MYEYISIERSYACGGHQIAAALAKRLNYRLHDHSVVVETCKRLELPYDMIAGMDEQTPVMTPFRAKGEKLLPLEEQIYNTQRMIIRDAAKEPGCIFVGRCASEELKDKKCLRVFITAPFEYRMERAVKVEKIPAEDVRKTMRKFDARREKYFTAHAGVKWGDPEYFAIILNSGRLGHDECVDILTAVCSSAGV